METLQSRDIPVCLIIPPSGFLADERVFPPLGVLKVAAELVENGNDVDVLDLSGFDNFLEIMKVYLNERPVRTFGLTATTPQLPAAAQISETIKGSQPDTKVILGGPHATLTHAALIQDQKAQRVGRGTKAFKRLEDLFDKLVVGDGEKAIFEAINPGSNQQVIDAGSRQSPLFLQKGQLDDFSCPSRHLIDLDSYHYEIEGHKAFSVIAQLGCPFKCKFCGGREAPTFRIARPRQVDFVIDEIESVVLDSLRRKKPMTGVMFYDDELNVVPENLENLCRGLINLQEKIGIAMRFRGFVKAELFIKHPDQAKLMHEAGFRMLLCGVESGSAEMLSAIDKLTTTEINATCLKMAQNAGIGFKALMSMGHPGESEKTIHESIKWVLKNKPDEVDWTIMTEYPGAPYFDWSSYDNDKKAWFYTDQKTGNRLWSREVDFAQEAEYYKGVPGNYTSYVWTDFLTPEDLVYLRDQAETQTRSELGLPLIEKVDRIKFVHQAGHLPQSILRSSTGSK